MSTERGVAGAALLVVVAVVVVAIGGVAVDLWRVLEAQRRLSGQVDAAATAAASAVAETSLRSGLEMTPTLDAGAAVDRACEMLVGTAAVERCPHPGLSIDVARTAVRIEVTRRVDLLLIGRLGVGAGSGGSVDVAAVAVAELRRGVGAGP